MTKVLITGAAGFVGANLSQYLAAAGYDVYSMVRNFSGARIKFVAGKTLLGDVADPESSASILATVRPDVVCHTAMYGGNSGQENAPEMFRTNLNGTVRMLENSHRAGVKLFINTGSSSEYGLDNDRHREEEKAEPVTIYGYTKLAGTEYAEYMGRIQTEMSVVTLRLFSAYGPLERGVRFMPSVLKAALRGELPKLGDPNGVRDFVYIDDVCRAYQLVIADPRYAAGVYNIGSGKQTTLDTAVGAIKQVTSCSAEPSWSNFGPRDLEPKKWRANPDLFESHYAWKPQHLHSGIVQFADWMRRNPDVVIP